jgi:hypothetical protein
MPPELRVWRRLAGQGGVARVGDEPAVPVEHPGHQRAVDRPERHHDRQVAGHQSCPNVAPGTGATLCQAPSRAEAAVAEMTPASARASSIRSTAGACR